MCALDEETATVALDTPEHIQALTILCLHGLILTVLGGAEPLGHWARVMREKRGERRKERGERKEEKGKRREEGDSARPND